MDRVLVHPKSIEVYYFDRITSRTKALKIVEAMKRREETPFIVEKTGDNRYLLVNGYIEYAALLNIQPHHYIHCLVKKETNERERIIRIIQSSFSLESTSWLFKNKYITILTRDYYMTPEQIARETKIPVSIIKNSLFDTRIPIHIQKKAADLNIISLIEEIKQSPSIPAEMKPFLYERTILPEAHALQLSSLKLLYFKEFCSTIYIPDYLISNLDLLEQFIDELLIKNFKLTSHWNQLLRNFIKNNRLHSLPNSFVNHNS